MKLASIRAILTTIALGLCACGPGSDTNTEHFLQLGANLPLSGAKSYYGVSAQKGIELAIDQLKVNERFGDIKIEVIYEDNQAQPRQAQIGISKLINVNKVPAVIGGGTSAESNAMATTANESNVVLISPISSASSLSAAGDYFFRTCPNDSSQARDLAQWISDEGIRSIGVIYAQGAWGTGFKDDFTAAFEHEEIVKAADHHAMDYKPQLTALKAASPDALLLITYAKEGGQAVRQARELGLNQPIFGADPWSQADFRTAAGKAAEGIRYTTPVQFDGASFNAFRKAYREKYEGEEPDVYASNGYDCLMLLASIFQAGATNGREMRHALLSVQHMGATGVTKFDKNGDVVGKAFGRFKIVGEEPTQVK